MGERDGIERGEETRCGKQVVTAPSLALSILSASGNGMSGGAASRTLVDVLAGRGAAVAHSLVPAAANLVAGRLAGGVATLLVASGWSGR